jgi:hypothetical protein
MQPLTATDNKGKGKQAITIDASQASQHFDSDPDFYTQTAATVQFQQVHSFVPFHNFDRCMRQPAFLH